MSLSQQMFLERLGTIDTRPAATGYDQHKLSAKDLGKIHINETPEGATVGIIRLLNSNKSISDGQIFGRNYRRKRFYK